MSPDYLPFGSGEVDYWDMSSIDVEQSPQEQAVELKEDLAQVSYGDRLVLDIGWYPSFADDGKFRVSLIRDQDWDAPLLLEQCATWHELRDAVGRAVLTATNARAGFQ